MVDFDDLVFLVEEARSYFVHHPQDTALEFMRAYVSEEAIELALNRNQEPSEVFSIIAPGIL